MTENIYKGNDSENILRASWHDYHEQGYYMLTFVTEGRKRLLGSLSGSCEGDASVALSPVGEELGNSIADIPNCFPEVEVLEFVVMEDHCHICLHVRKPMAKHLGAVVGFLKKRTTTYYLHHLNMKEHCLHLICQLKPAEHKRQQQRLQRATVEAMAMLGGGATENKAATHNKTAGCNAAANNAATNNAATNNAIVNMAAECGDPDPFDRPAETQAGEMVMVLRDQVRCGFATSLQPRYIAPLWAAGYHDRIVTRCGQIGAQIRYIHRNPARLWLKRHSDDTYTKVRDVHIPLALSLAHQMKDAAVYWDERRDVYHSPFSIRHDGKCYADSYVGLLQHFLRYDSIKQEPFLRIRLCGNRYLLGSGRPMVRVRISRSVTREDFEKELNRLLSMCEREGAIAVSPFRSWSEKEVLRIIRLKGYDHIIIHGEGMWDGWKPQDGSTVAYQQNVPAWLASWKKEYAEKIGMGFVASGDMEEVYDGRCLFFALWPDKPKGVKAGKADCEMMNKMAEVMEQVSASDKEII